MPCRGCGLEVEPINTADAVPAPVGPEAVVLLCDSCALVANGHAPTQIHPAFVFLFIRQLRNRGCECRVVLEWCQHEGFGHLTAGHHERCPLMMTQAAGLN